MNHLSGFTHVKIEIQLKLQSNQENCFEMTPIICKFKFKNSHSKHLSINSDNYTIMGSHHLAFSLYLCHLVIKVIYYPHQNIKYQFFYTPLDLKVIHYQNKKVETPSSLCFFFCTQMAYNLY